MKLCKDCRWVTWPWKSIPRDGSAALCIHPSVITPPPKPDLVTGVPRERTPGAFCETQRSSGACGPEGTRWEPKVQPGGFV